MIIDNNISIAPYVMFEKFDDEAVLLDVRKQEHYGLDPITCEFLQSIQDGLSNTESISLILKQYDVSEKRLNQDLNVVLESLLEHELITLS